MDQFNNKDFKNLQAKWYKKAGYKPEFNELGHSDQNVDGRHYYNQYGHQEFAAKQRYYELAGQFLHSYAFKDRLEKKIWAMHSEGITIRQIAKTLKTYKSPVHRTIKHLKEEMIKQYTQEDNRE